MTSFPHMKCFEIVAFNQMAQCSIFYPLGNDMLLPALWVAEHIFIPCQKLICGIIFCMNISKPQLKKWSHFNTAVWFVCLLGYLSVAEQGQPASPDRKKTKALWHGQDLTQNHSVEHHITLYYIILHSAAFISSGLYLRAPNISILTEAIGEGMYTQALLKR